MLNTMEVQENTAWTDNYDPDNDRVAIFTINGKHFNSIKNACRVLKIPYDIVREKIRAGAYPAQAVRMCLKYSEIYKENVPVTYKYEGIEADSLRDLADKLEIDYEIFFDKLNGNTSKVNVTKVLNDIIHPVNPRVLTEKGYEVLKKWGVSKYLINASEKDEYNYRVYAKKLVVVENTAKSFGISVEEMVRIFKLDIHKILRKIQYDLPDDSTRKMILSCGQAVVKDKTIIDVLKDNKIHFSDYVNAVKSHKKQLNGINLKTFRPDIDITHTVDKATNKYEHIGTFRYTGDTKDTKGAEKNKSKTEDKKAKEVKNTNKVTKSKVTQFCESVLDISITMKKPILRDIKIANKNYIVDTPSKDVANSINSLRVRKIALRDFYQTEEFSNYNKFKNAGYWILSKVNMADQTLKFLVYDGIHDDLKLFSPSVIATIFKNYPGFVRNVKDADDFRKCSKGKVSGMLAILPSIHIDDLDSDGSSDEYNPITVTRIEDNKVEAYDKYGNRVTFYTEEIREYYSKVGIINILSSNTSKGRGFKHCC